MKNNRGMTTGATILLIVALGALIYFGSTSNWFGLGTPATTTTPNPNPQGPSSGQTAVTILSTDALAATTTSAPATAYVFSADGSTFVSANTINSASTPFNVNYGNLYQVIAGNFSAGASAGYYPVQFTINANSAALTKTIQLYKQGSVNMISVTSSADPAQGTNISAAVGKTCGFNVNFAENTTAAAYNSPLLMCQANVSSVTQVNMGSNGIGVVPANNLAPSRVSATSGYTYWTFNIPKMVLSTDGTYKLSGSVVFNPTVAPATGDGITCIVVDQDAWINSNYQAMSLSAGFQTNAQNMQTLADIGAPDSNSAKVTYNSSLGYC